MNRIFPIAAIVEAERLFVNVTEQVERLHADISSIESALEQAPKILHAVGVNLALNVFDGMIELRNYQPIQLPNPPINTLRVF